MLDYYQRYYDFQDVVSNIRQQVIKDNNQVYPNLKNLFGFHYWLQANVADTYNNITMSEHHELSSFIHRMFGHNFLTFYDIQLALESNLIQPARALKRIVLESLVKMNYLAFFPHHTWPVFFHDSFVGIRNEEDKKQKFVQLQSLPYFKNNTLDDLLKKTNRKYYFKWFVDQIYDGPTRQSMHKLHQSASHSSHPSLIRSQQNYESQTTTLEILDLRLMLFYNILAEVEGHQYMTQQKIFPISEVKSFVDEMLPHIRVNGQMASLFPDHPNIASRVSIHPPGKPWD